MSESTGSEIDPNMVRIEELEAKQASGAEFSDEEMTFLERMSDDPSYPVSVVVDEADVE